ncbi:MAG: hypothetical protein HYU80_03745 [Candidatus Blackburnbacteria bacterium]|nr:hypothetical protein [Candidatus Blackburnbacteria bacterium]
MVKDNDLVTKQYLEERFSRFEEEIEERLLKPLRNDLANMKDEIIAKLNARQEEDDVHQYSHQRINDELTGHEGRISILETSKS